LRIGQAMEQRLVELEETVETLLQHPEWQDAHMERLERRLQRLESAMQAGQLLTPIPNS
jgi:TolA-binding protein